MSQRRHFKTQEGRERKPINSVWEEEIRQKAVRVVKCYQVILEVERAWQVARSLFFSSTLGDSLSGGASPPATLSPDISVYRDLIVEYKSFVDAFHKGKNTVWDGASNTTATFANTKKGPTACGR